ncbi:MULTISPECIES: Gfo/Idh/MocA family oxidoreductase [unclassified Sporosarcina]|uniref:Gfo/Idh/MocA family oxidoreductase n=1 Tax=unclassified Sporosarcina TaxID=2647733 RepID=UPI0020837554|nr:MULTISPECIES: Gfo/Idh/MocA family oxidoreductase [unclassified Sporosarcina]GKV65863.1 scyllo-inositol 2-dehydrogenase (NAD(+)) [Sporosarcina sp. NCCP-2331]GLB55988.1 scyllo-inositol 2-dehydrogenase (NAD(+)) [Sporosarcina sp. NCCP-2378]
MSNQVTCAVIGVGRLGIIHAENLVMNIAEANVKYIAASREESAKKAAQALGVDLWTNDLDVIWQDETVNAVIIATPTHTHAELILKAAKHKKHVFVDKPLTSTVEEADTVISSVKENKIICQVGFMRRFAPAYVEAKKRINRGDIGKPILYRGVSRDPGSPPESYIKTSGGIFLDLCIHDYDIARYLMDSEVDSIQTFGTVQMHPFMKKYTDVDQSLSHLVFTNGSTAVIEGSRNSSYGYDIRGEVLGTEGMIEIGSIQQCDNLLLKDGYEYFENIPDFPSYFREGFLNEMEHFIECAGHGHEPLVNELDGKIALQISEAARESFEKNKKIHINRSEENEDS